MLAVRVGEAGSSWEDKGSSCGAVSDGRQKRLGMLVRDALSRGPLELTLRLVSLPAFMAPETTHGEATLSLDDRFGKKPLELKLGAALCPVSISVGEPNLLEKASLKPAMSAYADGSNRFGVDPSPQLSLSKKELESCTLHGDSFVPAVAWVSAHLAHAGVAVRRSQGPRSPLEAGPAQKDAKGEPVTPHLAGGKAGWGAAGEGWCLCAVPQLETANGRVVNDPFIISRAVLSALYGGKGRDEKTLSWERKIGYTLLPAIWAEMSGADYANLFARNAPNFPFLFTSPLSPLPLYVRHTTLGEVEALRSRVGGEVVALASAKGTVARVCAEFSAELAFGKGKFFLGSNSPGPTDVSFYGALLVTWLAEVGPVRAAVADAQLLPWFESMLKLLPPAKVLGQPGPCLEGWRAGWLLEPPQAKPARTAGAAAGLECLRKAPCL